MSFVSIMQYKKNFLIKGIMGIDGTVKRQPLTIWDPTSFRNIATEKRPIFKKMFIFGGSRGL